MQNVPSKDLSELVDFPCDFSIKSIGLATDEFLPSVIDTMRRKVPGISSSDASCKPSKGGKFHSVTVKFRADSAEHVKAVYADLRGLKSLVMCL